MVSVCVYCAFVYSCLCVRLCVTRTCIFSSVAGLGLLDVVKELQDVDNEALQTQLAVWEESKAGDEEELEALGGIDLHNHEDAFRILMSKVGIVCAVYIYMLTTQHNYVQRMTCKL